MSRLADQYALVVQRQFYQAAESVAYHPKDGSAVVNLKGIVERGRNIPNEKRGDGEYEISRSTLTVMAAVDAVYGGVVLATVDALNAFRGTLFDVAFQEGGSLVSDWRVESISGGAGTWELGLLREKRLEVGNARKARE